jgi:AcrR family transcriptional regulator
MNNQLHFKMKSTRPRRGSPEQTRDRLIAAAAALFNRAGYHGTDSNHIARAAGYSTGSFYKHFKDKREIFLAAYETWVSSEWKEVAAVLSEGGSNRDIARRLVKLSVEFHTRWRGLRASLRELVFTDARVRRFYRKLRRRQLDLMADLRKKRGRRPHRREEDLIHLYTTERTYDAIAQGELREMGLSRTFVLEAMLQNVISVLV